MTKMGPVMLDLLSLELTTEECDILQHPLLGGVILFSRNYATPKQLKELVKTIRTINPALLLAVDQEGGRVQRFREEFTPLPAAAEFGEVYQLNPAQAKHMAENAARTMAGELRIVGIDFSFAPVLDIDQGISKVIGDRSFGKDREQVAELAEAYLNGMMIEKMAAVGKHAPGHGAVSQDSHTELPVDNRDFAEIWAHDLYPYRILKHKLAGIMMSHILYPQIDNKPAGFSKYWIQNIFRNEIHYNGAIFSDDLNMVGAEKIGNMLERSEAALEAGCDMILICNNRPAAINVLDNLKYKMTEDTELRLQKFRQ